MKRLSHFHYRPGQGKYLASLGRLAEKMLLLLPIIFFVLPLSVIDLVAKPSSPVKIHISADKKSLEAGQVCIVTCEITSRTRTTADLKITLPESLALIEGELAWSGEILPGIAQTVVIQVQAPGDDVYTIKASAQFTDKAEESLRAVQTFELVVGDAKPAKPAGQVSDSDTYYFTDEHGQRRRVKKMD